MESGAEGKKMAQDERLRAAEQLLARERALQEMRARALSDSRTVRRKRLVILVPGGIGLGAMLAPVMDAPWPLVVTIGAAGGWLAAVLLARRAG